MDNLIATFDVTYVGQSKPVPLQHHMEMYQKRCESFGWNIMVVDGHSMEELCKDFDQANNKPLAIIAKT